MKTSSRILLMGIFVVVVIVFVSAMLSRPEKTQITLNDQTFTVRVADNAVERYRGLSGIKEERLGADGMMFVYGEAEERTFVMRGMKFALDFVWLRDGKVVRVDQNIQPPASGEEPIEIKSSPLKADTVIEFPAGFAKKYDIFVGTSLR